MDVEGAFLHVNLMEEVYIKQPKGFEDHKQPKKVWHLLKSLYSLKQVPFEWNQVIDSHLHANGFEPTRLTMGLVRWLPWSKTSTCSPVIARTTTKPIIDF
jgi:hypothetical protein